MDHGTKIKLDLKKQYYYNNTKTHSVSGFIFGGPYGPKFELFQKIIA